VKSAVPAPTATRRLRVLAVDDSDEALELVERCFGGAGHEVETAHNGQEALAKLLGAEPPDVIVLDLVMPVMDGWELLRVLRSYLRFADVPVVVLSAHRLPLALAADPRTHFVDKPFHDESLLALADELARPRD
jgi:CheY-like chemotaxis protein